MKTTDVQRLVYRMLTENTGSHFLDSGGAYGRNHERNRKKTIKDFINEPEESYEFDYEYGDIVRTVSLFHYMCGLELDEVCEKFNRRNTNPKDWDGNVWELEDTYGVSDRAGEWLRHNHEVDVKYTFNTYNGDSDLSQILQGSLIEIDGDEYYLLQVHGGCDARGGYTDAKLFKKSYYSCGIHEYLWEWKDDYETLEDLNNGYIDGMWDYWNGEKSNNATYYHRQTILDRLEELKTIKAS